VIVSEAVDVFTAVPFTSVVAVIVYVPVHVRFRIGNGNEILFEVFRGKVNGGVVKISVFLLLQLLGCRGPLSVNFTTTVCALVEHDINFAATVTVPPCFTVDGEMLSNRPQTICSASTADELWLKLASPL
jgi:hypothetical protein